MRRFPTRQRSTAPYFTTAKFDGMCAETGAVIKRGDRIAYYPQTRKAYDEHSRHADELRGLQFAQTYAMPDANY